MTDEIIPDGRMRVDTTRLSKSPPPSNVVLSKNKILVQVTKNYHVPFELTVDEADTLWEGLDVIIGEYKASHAKNPFCNCGHKRKEHTSLGGRCNRKYYRHDGSSPFQVTDPNLYNPTISKQTCGCTTFDLDKHFYRPSSQYVDVEAAAEIAPELG